MLKVAKGKQKPKRSEEMSLYFYGKLNILTDIKVTESKITKGYN